jgi:Tol biopolymer transport system component/tetratricopeptide (TPR) repeat protein
MGQKKRIPNPYVAGPPLTGEQGFFGREAIFQFVRETLGAGQKVIVLFGQRRIGKTSLLHQLQRPIHTPPGFHPVYFDLQGKASQRLAQVLDELTHEIAASFELLPSANKFGVARKASNFDRLFLPAVYDALGDEQLLLLFDEFDVLGDEAPRRAAVSTLFPYLQQLTEKAPKLAFIFVVGRRLEELPTYYGSIFKTAHFYRVSLLDRANAVRLITEPAAGVLTYDEATIDKILSLTASHPYLTQVLCFELFAYKQRQGQSQVTAQDIEVVIERATDRGETGLVWFWNGLPQAEQFIFAAMAHVTEAHGSANRDEIRQVLRQHGVEFLGIELTNAPDRLVEWQMLKEIEPGRYSFVIELVRRWVADKHPVEEVKRNLEHAVPRATHLYEAGRSAQEEGDLESAVRHYSDALKANPAHLRARLALAYALFEKGQLQESLREFEQAYRLDPDSARDGWVKTLVELGKMAYREGVWRDALHLFEQAVALSPQNKEATAWLQDTKEQQQLEAWYHQAQDSIEKENWKAAVGLLEKILRRKSAYRDAAELLKRVRRQIGLAALYEEAEQQMNSGNWVAASEALRQILAQVQGYREAENLLRYCTARASEVKEEWSEAVRLYDEILSAERSFHDVSTRLEEARRQARLQWLYSEAQTQEELGQWTRAVEHYEQIYDITPTYRDVASRLQEGRQQRDLAETYQAGLRHMRRRRWNQAIETFRRVIEQTPDYRDAKLRLQESLTRREEQYSALRRFYYFGILSLATTVLIWIIFGAGASRILGALFSPRTPSPSPSDIVEATATPTIMTDTPTLATESPPAISTPIPLAEAGSFLFSSTREDNNAELYSMNADGSDQQRLTWHRARDQSPRRSPDGSKIVFVSDREGIDALYLTDAENSQPVRLTKGDRPARNPTWSPDGKWIAFELQNEEGDWDIWVMRPDGESDPQPLIEEIGRDGAPTWSPQDLNGNWWIAFHSERTGQFQIWRQEILDIDELTKGQLLQVTSDAGSHKYPAWSPDGERLAYTLEQEDRSEIFIIHPFEQNAQETIQRRLPTNLEKVSWPVWYPDGGWIAYVAQIESVDQICVVPSDAEGEPRCLTMDKENRWPDWSVKTPVSPGPSPTPTFTSTPTPTHSPTPTPIATNTPEPTPQDTDTPTPTPTFTPTPTPIPPEKLAYVSTEDGDAEIFVYVFGVNGSDPNPRKLTNNTYKDESPSWSPDGQQIAFTRENSSGREITGNHNIWIMNADGTGEQMLAIEPADVTAGNADEMWPAWSPDSEWLALQANWDGDNDIYIVNLNSNDQRYKLTHNDDSDEMPSWSADGRRVVYHSDASGVYQLYAIEVLDETRQLVIGGGSEPEPERLTKIEYNHRRPVWSPTSNRLAFWSDQDGNDEIYIKEDATQIEDQGPFIRITNLPSQEQFPTWSPDGQRLAFVSDRNGYRQIFIIKTPYGGSVGTAGALSDDEQQPLIPGEGEHYHPAWWGPR